jgi:hypothetical protein
MALNGFISKELNRNKIIKVKDEPIETHARAFLLHISLASAGVRFLLANPSYKISPLPHDHGYFTLQGRII